MGIVLVFGDEWLAGIFKRQHTYFFHPDRALLAGVTILEAHLGLYKDTLRLALIAQHS